MVPLHRTSHWPQLHQYSLLRRSPTNTQAFFTDHLKIFHHLFDTYSPVSVHFNFCCLRPLTSSNSRLVPPSPTLLMDLSLLSSNSHKFTSAISTHAPTIVLCLAICQCVYQCDFLSVWSDCLSLDMSFVSLLGAVWLTFHCCIVFTFQLSFLLPMSYYPSFLFTIELNIF